MNLPHALRLLVIGLGLMVAELAFAAEGREVAAVYQPLRVELASLSPDGERVVFVVKNDRGTELQVVQTVVPYAKTVVPLRLQGLNGVRELRWISPNELLILSPGLAMALLPISTGKPRLVDTAQLAAVAGLDVQLGTARVTPVPDDPASVLVEATAFRGAGNDTPNPYRPLELDIYRLNIMTGAARRILNFLIERQVKPGDVITDQQGEPRIIHRYWSAPQTFLYRDKTSEQPTLGERALALIWADAGWTDLWEVLSDEKTFNFRLGPQAFLREHTTPIAFGPDRNILIYASNVGRDTLALYEVDLRTAKRTGFAVEEPGIDLVDIDTPWRNPPLVFDRERKTLVGVRLRHGAGSTRWLDPELAQAQAGFERQLPGRPVEMLEWDRQRENFLGLVGGFSEPGRYFVYRRSADRATEYLNRAPLAVAGLAQPVEAFAFTTPAGVRINGYLTRPRQAAQKSPPPVIIALHDGPWKYVGPEYDRDAQALATMGFIVAKINYRGSTGFGIAHREAIRTALDTAPLDDVVATLDWLRTARRIDTRRVGILGEGYGGFLALRGLQLHPELFLAGVAINALTAPLIWATSGGQGGGTSGPGQPSDPDADRRRWLIEDQHAVHTLDVTLEPDRFTQPVFLLHNPGSRTAPLAALSALRSKLRRRSRLPDWMDISPAFDQPASPQRREAYQRIGEFFSLTLNTFSVQIGESREQPAPPAAPPP